jgi:hypothetical protein
MCEEHHLALDDERKEKLLQSSTSICTQQIELNTHLILATGSHHCSGTENWFGTVGHVEAHADVRTDRDHAVRMDHHAIQAEVERFAFDVSLFGPEAHSGSNFDAAKAALFLFDGALRDTYQPLQAGDVDRLIEEEAGASVESLGNRGRSLIMMIGVFWLKPEPRACCASSIPLGAGMAKLSNTTSNFSSRR